MLDLINYIRKILIFIFYLDPTSYFSNTTSDIINFYMQISYNVYSDVYLNTIRISK